MFWTVYVIGWLSLHRLVVFFLELWTILSFGPLLFLSQRICYIVRARALGVHQHGATQVTTQVTLYMGEGSEKEQCHLLCSLPVFSHFPCYPQSNWALLVLIPRWVGFVYVLGPCRSLQWTLLWVWEFLPLLPKPPRCFQSEVLRLYFPRWNSALCSLSCSPIVPPGLSAHKCGLPSPQVTTLSGLPAAALPAPVLQLPPLLESSLPSCLSPPLLLVWMNVSSLSPWFLDFHTVRFSVSSGYFFSF